MQYSEIPFSIRMIGDFGLCLNDTTAGNPVRHLVLEMLEPFAADSGRWSVAYSECDEALRETAFVGFVLFMP